MENTAFFKNDLASFHVFVAEHLKSGGQEISPEQALALWRERLEAIESIGRGLADVEAGRTRLAKDLLEDVRNGHRKP